jgi:hypothetical protein
MSEKEHANKKLELRHDFIAGSEFEDLNMAGTRFTNINLSNARFHDINFSDVSFTAVQIGGALFKHIGPPPCGEQKRQRPVTFEEAMLMDSIFRKVDMSNVQIIDCNIEGMKIDGILVTEMLAAYRRGIENPP